MIYFMTHIVAPVLLWVLIQLPKKSIRDNKRVVEKSQTHLALKISCRREEKKSRAEQANIFYKSANNKSARSWAHSDIVILKSFVGRPQQISKSLWLIRKSKIRKFLQNAEQLCLKKFSFLPIFWNVQIWIRI